MFSFVTGQKLAFILVISQSFMVALFYYTTTTPHGTTTAHVTTEHPSTNRSSLITVALGLGLTSVNTSDMTERDIYRLPFFSSLMTSFCNTSSGGFEYHFFIGYDYNDLVISRQSFRRIMKTAFLNWVHLKCPGTSSYFMHFVTCRHSGKPAWAQNDVMLVAYMAGMEYLYRINDDIFMKTTDWTNRFIDTLQNFKPPRIGVVGPTHNEGNTDILILEFTHRTHIDIVGFYYPRVFTDWYGDKWITDIYMPARSVKLPDVLVYHTQEVGQRYKHEKRPDAHVLKQIDRDRDTLSRYISAAQNGFPSPDEKKVISMYFYRRSSAHAWGVVRNAQLAPVIFPGWTIRLYTNQESDDYHINNNLFIPQNIIKTVEQLGGHVVYLNSDLTNSMPTELWSHLVADDPEVDLFLIRNPDERLSERDYSAVKHWINSDSPRTVLCVKGHPKHVSHPIIEGLWGARSKELHLALQSATMRDLISQTAQSNRYQLDFLEHVFYPKVSGHVLCYDTFSCDKSHSVESISEGDYPTYVGQKYDSHEQPVLADAFHSLPVPHHGCDGIS